MPLTRRTFLVVTLAIIAVPAFAHHGWRWTDSGDFELTGIITEARLGNPHGVLTIDADGETWLAEVGQPHRNAAAGLDDGLLAVGTEVTILGKRSADPAELLVKAERVTIAGVNYDLYPERL
jgi:hypothetical protein